MRPKRPEVIEFRTHRPWWDYVWEFFAACLVLAAVAKLAMQIVTGR